MILNINSVIQIELLAGIESTDSTQMMDDFCSYFTTEMSPMFASAIDVRRLIGGFITEIPDDVINQLILEWSYIALDLSNCSADDKWKRYANKWVAYKVALVILYNTEEFRGVGSDKDFKQLGDFSISRGGGTTTGDGISKMIDWLECEAFKYEYSIRECTDPLMNCLGLEDKDALPYRPKLAQIVEKGEFDPNKAIGGRRWITEPEAEPRGNNEIYFNKRKYKTNLGTRYIYGHRSL